MEYFGRLQLTNCYDDGKISHTRQYKVIPIRILGYNELWPSVKKLIDIAIEEDKDDEGNTRLYKVENPQVLEAVSYEYEDNPQIIATGFCSQAEYDFLEDEFTPTGQCYDITPSGEWKKDDGKLVGKEFIIIPQAIGEEQTLQMEWNGRIYTCAMPEIEETDGNVQYEIEIDATENTSHLFSGIVANIEKWPVPIEKETDNGAQYSALHLSILSFKPSNVYHIHSGGKIIAEICKEYLQSDDLTTQAIVSYPIKANETADLSKGTVLQLLDIEEDINGGTLEWDLDDNTFTYDEGDSPRLQQICYDEQGNVLTEQSDEAVNINAIAYTLRDTRDSKDIKQYPIVKIGTQYWMRSNLQATMYRDGTEIEDQTVQGTEAGYFTEDEEEYFYNGYVLEEEGKYLAPDGWRIPSEEDWNMLDEYVEGDASLLKETAKCAPGHTPNGPWQTAIPVNFAARERLTSPTTKQGNPLKCQYQSASASLRTRPGSAWEQSA